MHVDKTKLFFLSFLFLAALSLIARTDYSNAFSDEVYILQLDDATINPVTAEYIINSLKKAQEEDVQCLIIEIDTPGGLLSSTRSIVKKLMSSKIPVVIYIYPSGSRAGSAGVFITYASHVAAMAPSTNIGAAHPVQLGGSRQRRSVFDALRDILDASRKRREGEDLKKKDTEHDESPMESKILEDTVAFIKAIAKERGRNVEWAQDAVVKSKSITEKEALEKGVIEIIAKADVDLLRQLDGRMVKVQDEELTLRTKEASIRYINMNFRQRFLNVLANPNIAYFLLILGFYGLLYEVTHPGIGVPGIVGAIFLILAFFSMQTLPTNYAGLALIALGIILLIAEAMTPGFGLLALGGLTCLVLGSIILFDSPDPFMRVSLSLIIPLSIGTATLTLFLVSLVIRAHKRKALSGQEGLIDSEGEAKTNIKNNKKGKVFVHGELWNATSDENIKKGDKIVVAKVDGMTLTVKKK